MLCDAQNGMDLERGWVICGHGGTTHGTNNCSVDMCHIDEKALLACISLTDKAASSRRRPERHNYIVSVVTFWVVLPCLRSFQLLRIAPAVRGA